ncbi:MAG TPA: acetylxylan esterase [Acidobacteriota bacterium]|jgi:hypothetical protein|nr:acetylxylan esterase [Acidobacteriota bacterium]
MKRLALFLLLASCITFAQQHYKTLNDRFSVPPYPTLEAWKERAVYLREHILASAGLLPMPEKTPLNTSIFDEQKHNDYSVFKVYFESLPGFFVTGNLYMPSGSGPFPAILSPHGHWTYGRLENTELASVPGRAINLARQGFVVFAYDMIGYNDSRQLTHKFGGKKESLWGLSLAGLQLWNSIRSVDFLESLPAVDRNRIGCTGASGGGTQTFLLAAVDNRIKAAAPVNMISLHMQGGCLCENLPGLRIDANNVELAACIAPRPLLMVSATGDWTNETMRLEYPEMRKIYALFGAEDRVHAVQFQAQHNYNRQSREAMYAWMARWLKSAAVDATVSEKGFHPEMLPDLLVFYGRTLPANAVTAGQLTEDWIAAAKKQLAQSDPRLIHAAFRHALATSISNSQSGVSSNEVMGASKPQVRSTGLSPLVVLASDNRSKKLEGVLGTAGLKVKSVTFTPFDAESASKISHFETYNRTQASQRVQDIVQALVEAGKSSPAVILIADGDAALAGLLAQAVVPVKQAILDVDHFDNSSDETFVQRLYVPGIRRAGDFRTALSISHSKIVLHNAGENFKIAGAIVEKRKLNENEILNLLEK